LNFPITIAENKRIPFLEKRILDEEGDLIFNYLLERLKELKKINFKFTAPDSVSEFTVSTMDEQDNISIFLADYIANIDDEKGSTTVLWEIPMMEFYNKYKASLIDGGFTPTNVRNFKDNAINWASRRDDISVDYFNNGKNFVFKFSKNSTILKDDILVDGNGKELF